MRAGTLRREERARQQQAHDRLRVGDLAGGDELLHRGERDPLDDEMLLLDSVRTPRPSREAFGEEAGRQLVTVPGRVPEAAELGEAFRPGADLLGELARRTRLGGLAGDVELAGG